MTPLVARILLTVIMFPLFICGGFMFGFILDGVFGLSDREALILTFVLTCSGAGVCWVLLWRGVVVWSPTRVSGTLIVLVGSCLAALLIGVFVASVTLATEAGVVFACLSGLTLWMGSTVFVWRETPEEFSARIKGGPGRELLCPTCGYTMVGLYESRCPECGTRYTLDQLYASQDAESSGLSSDGD